MSLLKPSALFYKDCAIAVLEMRGDYETWVTDVQEYFNVSGFQKYFDKMTDSKIPVYTDCDGVIPEDKIEEYKTRHSTILKQAHYIIYKSTGPTIKREIKKEGYVTKDVAMGGHQELFLYLR